MPAHPSAFCLLPSPWQISPSVLRVLRVLCGSSPRPCPAPFRAFSCSSSSWRPPRFPPAPPRATRSPPSPLTPPTIAPPASNPNPSPPRTPLNPPPPTSPTSTPTTSPSTARWTSTAASPPSAPPSPGPAPAYWSSTSIPPAGPLLATLPFQPTGGWDHWQDITANVDHSQAGVRDVYLLFRAPPGEPPNPRALVNLRGFVFLKSTITPATDAPDLATRLDSPDDPSPQGDRTPGAFLNAAITKHSTRKTPGTSTGRTSAIGATPNPGRVLQSRPDPRSSAPGLNS